MDLNETRKIVELGNLSINELNTKILQTKKTLDDISNNVSNNDKQKIEYYKANLNRIIALGKNGDLNKITAVVNQIKNKTWE